MKIITDWILNETINNTALQSAKDIKSILDVHKFAYLPFECRTMKTSTSIYAIHLSSLKRLLFITSKKAIEGVRFEIERVRNHVQTIDNKTFDLQIDVINYESVHKILGNSYDCKILDECHRINANPRPYMSKRVKLLTSLRLDIPTILMSGTPDSEGSGLRFWQCKLCKFSPLFNMKWKYWVENYINVKHFKGSDGRLRSEYKQGKTSKIDELMKDVILRKSQIDAGICTVNKEITTMYYDFPNNLINVYNAINNNNISIINGFEVTAETSVSKLNKLHQLTGGTIIHDTGEAVLLSYSKIRQLIEQSNNFLQFAIVYNFKAELTLIMQYLDKIGYKYTTDLELFNTGDYRVFLGQQRAICEGVNLSIADALILYSFNYSATTYLQVIERLTNINRIKPIIIKVMLSKQGLIDNRIYSKLIKKQSFTGYHYA